jgi:hypothetical protein
MVTMGKNTPSDAEDDTSQLESPIPPDKQVIPRRFPRIGSQFQTKIAKGSDPLDRPPPDRMSEEYPYATEAEVIISGKMNVSDMATGYGRFMSSFSFFPLELFDEKATIDSLSPTQKTCAAPLPSWTRGEEPSCVLLIRSRPYNDLVQYTASDDRTMIDGTVDRHSVTVFALELSCPFFREIDLFLDILLIYSFLVCVVSL